MINLRERARDLFLRGFDTQAIAMDLGMSEAALYNSGWYTKAKEPKPVSVEPKRLGKGQLYAGEVVR